MLEIISNLRNNNLRKIPGYDSSRIEHLRKVLRSVTRESSKVPHNKSSDKHSQKMFHNSFTTLSFFGVFF